MSRCASVATGPKTVMGSSGSPTGAAATVVAASLDDFVVALGRDDDAGRDEACLAGVAQTAAQQHAPQRVEIDVGQNECRRLAAEFEGDRLEQFAARCGHTTTDRCGAGERHLVHSGVPNEAVPDRAVAGDQVDHARRDAGLRRRVDDESDRQRGRRCRLDDDRAPGQKGRRELDDDEVDREVPRRDERAHADRIAMDRRVQGTVEGRDADVFGLQVSGEGGERSQYARRIRRAAGGLRHGRPVLQSGCQAERFGSPLQRVGHGEHEPRPLRW